MDNRIYKYLEMIEDIPDVSNDNLRVWRDVVISINFIGLIKVSRRLGNKSEEFLRYAAENCVGKFVPDENFVRTAIIFNEEHIKNIESEWPTVFEKYDLRSKLRDQSAKYLQDKIDSAQREPKVTFKDPLLNHRFSAIKGETDCDFEECEDLKNKWERDLEAIGGEDCTACAKSRLIRKYTRIISNLS